MPSKSLFPSPFTAAQGRENKIGDSSKVEIRELTKEKVKVCVCTSKEEKKIHTLPPISNICK